MANIRITKNKQVSGTSIKASRYVKAADDEDFSVDEIDEFDDDSDGFLDRIDDVADNVEDLQDIVEDVKEDAITISINNNIENHYIAECEDCEGIFISAVIESNQEIDHVSGVCPLCGKETDQYLKWVIKSV